MVTFNKKYFFWAISLFVVEVLIALFVHDKFVRPYVGDFLVVILMYCAVRTFIRASVVNVVVSVLLFAYAVEVLQYFHLVNKLGLEHNTLAKTVMGYGFEWKDLLAYTIGAFVVLVVEKQLNF